MLIEKIADFGTRVTAHDFITMLTIREYTVCVKVQVCLCYPSEDVSQAKNERKPAPIIPPTSDRHSDCIN